MEGWEEEREGETGRKWDQRALSWYMQHDLTSDCEHP